MSFANLDVDACFLNISISLEQARIVDVSTRSFGLNSPAVAIRGDEDEDYDGRKLCYLPSFARTYSLWYQRHYLSVTRTESQDGIYHMKEVLQIEYVVWSKFLWAEC